MQQCSWRINHEGFPGWERFFSSPSFAFVLPEERVQNLQGRSHVLRDNICRAIQKKAVCEYLSGIISVRRAHRGSKNRKTLLATITHNYPHKTSFQVEDQEDKNHIRWRSNQYVLAGTKLLSVVRCTNWENVTYRSTLPVANPISVHIAFHF